MAVIEIHTIYGVHIAKPMRLADIKDVLPMEDETGIKNSDPNTLASAASDQAQDEDPTASDTIEQ